MGIPLWLARASSALSNPHRNVPAARHSHWRNGLFVRSREAKVAAGLAKQEDLVAAYRKSRKLRTGPETAFDWITLTPKQLRHVYLRVPRRQGPSLRPLHRKRRFLIPPARHLFSAQIEAEANAWE